MNPIEKVKQLAFVLRILGEIDMSLAKAQRDLASNFSDTDTANRVFIQMRLLIRNLIRTGLTSSSESVEDNATTNS